MWLLDKLSRSGFVRNVATLMSGNLLAQVITVGSAPIITRLFSADDFGFLALYMAIVGVCTKVSSLCYERAIVLPEDDRDAIDVLMLSVLVLIGLVITIALISVGCNEWIASILDSSDNSNWFLLVPISILIIGLTNVMRYWALRHQRFKQMSASQVGGALFSAGTKVLFGFMIGASVGDLIVGTLIGNTVALVLLMQSAFRNRPIKPALKHARFGIKNVAHLYRQFPYFSTWNALIYVLSSNMVVFFLSYAFSVATVGFYHLAYRMLAQPSEMISQAVGRTFFQRSARQVSEGQQLVPGLIKIVAVLFIVGGIPFGILAMFGQPIFSLVFGDQWGTAGLYAQIMTPWFLMMFIEGPPLIVFEVCQQQALRLRVNLISMFLTVGALLVPYWLGKSVMTILVVFVVAKVFISIIQISLAVFVASRHDKHLYIS
jgi:O-antigen/teichoic acid export membrane protein